MKLMIQMIKMIDIIMKLLWNYNDEDDDGNYKDNDEVDNDNESYK